MKPAGQPELEEWKAGVMTTFKSFKIAGPPMFIPMVFFTPCCWALTDIS